jgi:hypothetical protein
MQLSGMLRRVATVPETASLSGEHVGPIVMLVQPVG